MDSTILIVAFAALIIAVFINIKCNVNLGIVAFAFAFLVGGFGLGLRNSAIVDFFPISLFFQLMVITLFYGFAVANGTFQKVADYSVYWCRNYPALIPWTIFVVAFVICAIGCPPPGIALALVAMAVAIQKRTGMDYYLSVSIVTFGAMGGGFMPMGLFATIIRGMLIKVGEISPELAAAMMTKVSIFVVITEITFALMIYIWAKGYRLNKLDIPKPEPMNQKQKQTLIIVVTVVLFIIVPSFLKIFIPAVGKFTNVVSALSLACIGACFCAAFKVANEREVIKNNVPWSLLIMISGAVCLIGVMNAAGLTTFLAGLFKESWSGLAVVLMFCVLAAALSFFVDSTGVVMPLFIPIVFKVAATQGLSPALLVAVVAAGAYAAGNCPLSTGGALMMSQTTDENRQKMFYVVWMGAFATVALAIILSFIGYFLPVW